MYLGSILYLTLFISTSVRSTIASILPSFTAIIDGIGNFENLLQNIYDIFDIAWNDDVIDIQDILSVSVPEDAYLNISQLANKYGYPFEQHTVTTPDGYVLNIHRIPQRKGRKSNVTVFLMHGILDASDSWVIQGPGKALSFILADEGFDVWMGNARGNKHSPTHVKYNSSEPEFWQFTWEQIALFDIPKMIDYILNETGRESLHYIGNSQGTTTFFVMNSMKPEYNRKIKTMYALAPVAWMSQTRLPIVRMLSPAHDTLGYYVSDVNTYVPSPKIFNKIMPYVCSVINEQCYNFLKKISGGDYRSLNGTMLPIMLGHMFSGTSILQFVHYAQLISSKRFCRYDYGPEGNFKTYGVFVPPNYDLSNITIPVGIFYSSNDWLSDIYDVNLLKKHLPNVFLYEHMDGYKHLDYLYAGDAKDRIFSKIIWHILDFERGSNVYFYT